jgi:hypothetical protein
MSESKYQLIAKFENEYYTTHGYNIVNSDDTDDDLKTDNISEHDTDDDLKTDNISEHDTDDILKTDNISEHDTDDILKTNNISEHDTDDDLKTDNISEHDTDDDLSLCKLENTKEPGNIPIECMGYTIYMKTNIYTFRLKNPLFVKYINKKVITRTINNKLQSLTLKFNISAEEQHIFNNIFDYSDCDIDEITDVLTIANVYFDEYNVSRKTQNTIDKYILNTYKSDNIWKNLTNKPDYNLCIFKKRMLPYYHLECKDWVKANLEAVRENYPPEIMRELNSVDSKSDWTDENILNTVTRNNNFLGWGVLHIDKYPDIQILAKRIILYYNLGLQRQALTLFLKLMLSPKECHIIKIPELWCLFKPHMCNSHIEEIVKYCYYYAMYILRHEETVMFSQVHTKYRVLFSLEEASALPQFHGTHIERNPYILQLTHNTRVSECIPFYVHGKRYINTDREFRRRFSLATGDAFKNVDLAKLRAAITGSILIPCVHKSPLEKDFSDINWVRERINIKTNFPFMVDTPESPEDYAFLNYLEYYYPSYVSLTDKDYKKQVLQPNTVVITDNDIVHDEDDVCGNQQSFEELTFNASKDIKINNTEPSEHKNIRPSVDYNQLADIDISITARDFDVFKNNTILLYDQIKDNCAHRGDVYIKEIKTLSSVKFKIYGPGLPRPMDIFRIPYEPAKMIKKFHVHAVKMYYDNNITMFRSCIACLLSGVGETYKWFSCNKVPIDVLLKYTQRGLSIILNKKERSAISKYLESNDRWGKMLKYLKIPADKIYQCTTESHPFFKPDLYDCGVRMNLRKFTRTCDSLYIGSLVVEYPKTDYPYGVLLIKDNSKQYPPNTQFINDCINYVESEAVDDNKKNQHIII